MTGCIVLGDSIALGIAAFANVMVPGGCDHRARIGASTADIARMAPARHMTAAFISAGSNDSGNTRLAEYLSMFRSQLRADRVVWVYPRAPAAAWAVYSVALEHGDRAISLARLPSKDGIHPSDYSKVAFLVFKQTVWARGATYAINARRAK